MATLRSSGIVARVAAGSSVSAMVAALVAATTTSVLTGYLVQLAQDKTLTDAARVLDHEIQAASMARTLQEIVRDELSEVEQTGVTFAIYAGASSSVVAGLGGVPRVAPSSCSTFSELRACAVRGQHGVTIVAASAHRDLTLWLALAAAGAAAVAGLGAWFASRPVAKWLVRVDDALDQAERFAADAAHELRTPLTTLRGELDLLAEDESLPAHASADVGRARAKVIELQTLVERLLILAMPDQSSWTASELVSLHEVIEDAIQELSDEDAKRVTVRASNDDATMRCDSALLRTLVLNALSNALKFGTSVSVSVTADDAELVLHVDDDGPGVPVAERESLFEPFVRGTDRERARKPGHGLGLAIVSRIARRHGGSAMFADVPSGARLAIRLARTEAVIERGNHKKV